MFRELKPKCCFVLTQFQVFEVQGTEFWKPQAALVKGDSMLSVVFFSEKRGVERGRSPPRGGGGGWGGRSPPYFVSKDHIKTPPLTPPVSPLLPP